MQPKDCVESPTWENLEQCVVPQDNATGEYTTARQSSRVTSGPRMSSSLNYQHCPEDIDTASEPSIALLALPNEILLHILGFLDVSDLLSTSRANHQLRELSLTPILHANRLRHTKAILPPLLSSPSRPSRSDLIARSIVQSRTSVVSRRLDRKLISIRLARRLAARPSAEILVQRCVLPRECVPGLSAVHVAPALVARRRAIEKERLKDGLRSWVGRAWKGEMSTRREAGEAESR
ncbi:hypothetical protein jhhlp_003072 [Lomentospora prolificans]|uniref:F-box domain-containing protein n=1 Tax=Lomentospora prolificans TaxID=41688 RepID=A0A2N3NFU2_9PEZI|nr:hypothetical protein jhhlp_003072 [Lomentospora prolificans]